MGLVNQDFAGALRAGLNGRYEALMGQAEATSPAAARQAGVEEEAIAAAAAKALGLEYIESLARLPASSEFVEAIPIAFARRHCLLGLAGDNGALRLAMADLAGWSQTSVLAKRLGRRIAPVFVPRHEVLRAVNAAYERQTGQAQRAIEELDLSEVLREAEGAAGSSEDLLDVAGRAPVIRLVNLILFEAVKRGASDVHIQPYEDRLVVRLRLDGVLHDVFEPPKALQDEIISRIKVIGRHEHRRAAAAAGRPRDRRGGRPRGRPSHRHAADRHGRTGGHPPARQERPPLHAG